MENQRVRLTKMLLKNALLQLLHQKPIEKVSVAELCRTAQINRVTFYKYYSTPADVLAEEKNEIVSELNGIISAYRKNSTHLVAALQFLRERQDEVLTLFKNIPGSELEECLLDSLQVRNILEKVIPDEYNEAERNRVCLFLCSGSYAIIRKWLLEGCQEPLEEIADFIHGFAQKLL